jgi:DeoR family glycerol-3-phosphate regulon repressor
MPSTQREREILELLAETGSGRILDLSRRLGVTEETIRRNVRRMEAAGLVRKVHGGVHLRDGLAEPPFAQRFAEHPAAKQRIARHLAHLIRDGESLFLDTGSTTAYVAQALRQRQGLLVVTNSLGVAQALAGSGSNRVFMAGGELRGHDGGAFGAEALAFVRQFRVRHAILSVAAIEPEGGFMLQDLREAEFSRQIIDCADQAIVAADAAKFTRRAPIRLIEAERIALLVTDAAPPSGTAAALAAAGVQVEIAPPARG